MRRDFFSADGDMHAVFEHVERKVQVKYVTAGVLSSPEIVSVASGSALARLGTDSDTYIIISKSTPIRPRLIQLNAGGSRFACDELANPEAVTLKLGRLVGGNVLLPSFVGTTAKSGEAIVIQKAFASAIGKHFVKVKSYWVGPTALSLLKSGVRLTIGPKSPREFDLVLEEKRDA